MIRLTVHQILMLHRDLILISETDGVQDERLLDPALHLQFQTFDKQAIYPSIQQYSRKLPAYAAH